MALVTGKPADIPDVEARIRSVRQDQKNLSAADQKLGEIGDQIFLKKYSLRPYDYSSGIASNRSELRALLRGMTSEQKAKALKKHEFRAAALELPAEASGLDEFGPFAVAPKGNRDKVSEQVRDIAEAEAALEVVRQAHKAAALAVQNELKATGLVAEEPTAAQPPKPWVSVA